MSAMPPALSTLPGLSDPEIALAAPAGEEPEDEQEE